MSTAFRPGQQEQAPKKIDIALPGTTRPRIESIDLMRGLVIVLMALDHTRDFIGTSRIDPLDADVTNLPLYLTRWITHLCAPTFCFLMGVGAYLAGQNKTKSQLGWLLLSRGLWLIFLELTVIKFALQLSFSFDMTLALVFWSLGWSLIFLSALVFLPSRIVGAIGVVMILTHNLLDGINAEVFGPLRPLWLILHQREVIELTAQSRFLVAYPLVPWIGVAAAGFGFGEIMRLQQNRRQTVMIALGLIMIGTFFVLRAIDIYGDPLKWSMKPTAIQTCFSFFNCQKNPASLLYLLVTLGPMLLLMAMLEHPVLPALISRALTTFGRVPLFFFVTHLYLIRVVALVAAAIRPLLSGVESQIPKLDFDLPIVYFWFVVVLIIMYFPCRWFAGVKARHRDVWWLGYL